MGATWECQRQGLLLLGRGNGGTDANARIMPFCSGRPDPNPMGHCQPPEGTASQRGSPNRMITLLRDHLPHK